MNLRIRRKKIRPLLGWWQSKILKTYLSSGDINTLMEAEIALSQIKHEYLRGDMGKGSCYLTLSLYKNIIQLKSLPENQP